MPETYTCVACSQPVSKRKSYAVEGGRACKIHQEAQEHVQQKKAAQKREKIKKTIAKKNRKIEGPAFNSEDHLLYKIYSKFF